MTPVFAALSPDAAVLLLTAGVGLVYFELNRPGSIVPGALGLLATLLGLAALGRGGARADGILLLLAATVVLAADLVRPTPILLALAATAALCVGLRELPARSGHAASDVSVPGWPTAVLCGLLLGLGSAVLTRLARRARVNKRTV